MTCFAWPVRWPVAIPTPIELVRALQGGGRPTTLGRAIAEYGRVPKTLHLLQVLNDENYRRQMLVQLNRQEGRHSLARAVSHGQKGELRKPYREGQEDQLGALGLVVNAIVLWNTRYIALALEQLRTEGFDVRDEDVERLSPLRSLVHQPSRKVLLWGTRGSSTRRITAAATS